MKILFYPILACLLVACTSEPTNEIPLDEVEVVESFSMTYVGTIDAKYPIVMQLTSDEGELTGKYFYQSKGGDLELKGTLNPNGSLTMDEFNAKGNLVGLFTGVLGEGEISGEWSNPDVTTIIDFKLMETKGDYVAMQEQAITRNALKNTIISGDYERDATVGDVGELSIEKLSDNSFSFYISIGNEFCTGELEGEVSIYENKTGVFSIEGCEGVSFRLANDGIYVEESSECDYHGARCSFYGFYKIQ